MLYCEKCGAKNLDNAEFCHKCGEKIGKQISKKRFWSSINWFAAVIGFLVGMLVTLLTVSSFGIVGSLALLPIVSGVVSVFLANDIKYKFGILTGIISAMFLGIPLIAMLGFGLIMLILGAFGGFLGVLLNTVLSKANYEVKEKRSRIESITNWLDKQQSTTKVLTVSGVIILAIILFAGIVSLSMPSNSQTGNASSVNNTTKNQTNETLSPEEMAKYEKMMELEKDPEFLSAIDNFVDEMYPDPMYNTEIDSVYIFDIISDNKIKVSLDVNWTTNRGDRVKDSYMGIWVKTNGVWKDTDDFTLMYKNKDGELYSPGEPLYEM